MRKKKINEENLFTYDGKILSIYDGDTFKISVDLGFGVHKVDKFRLYGLDTPESRGKGKCEKGISVKRKVIQLLTGIEGNDTMTGKPRDEGEWKELESDAKEGRISCFSVKIKTYKQEKFGRYLCDLVIVSDKGSIHLNSYLIKKGMAKEYYGEKR